MSVEKYRIVKESVNYTIMPNSVLQGLNDYEALGLYSYLVSLPDGWKFHKSQLGAHGNIGRDKLARLLKTLKQCNLVDFEQSRSDSGRFSEFDLHVKNGSEFIPINFKPEESPLTEKPLTENRAPETDSYKRNTTKEEGDKKKRAIGSPDLKSIPESFYPDEKRLALLEQHARRTNNPPHELLKKFQEVHTRYKTKSVDWQAAFEDFLIRELPKRTWEDTTGKLRRYDNKPIHY